MQINPLQPIEATRRREFGQRVRVMRKQAGLTRQELAARTSIPFKTIGNIERGAKVLLHIEWIVKPLADYFGLTGVTREAFFASAGLFADDIRAAEPAPHWSGLLSGFYRSTQHPALVTDPLYNIHSLNSYLDALYGLDIRGQGKRLFEGAGPNFIRFMLDPAFGMAAKFGTPKEWRGYVEGKLYSLRMDSIRYIGTPAYETLIRELSKFPTFGPIWQKVCQPDYVHRLAGLSTLFYPNTDEEMEFLVAYVFPTRFENVEHHRLLYIPANDQTKTRLDQLCNHVPPVVYHISQHFPGGYREVRFSPDEG